MAQIFFFSPNGYAPLKDNDLRMMLVGSHGWQSDGDTWVYGVCLPAPHINPHDIADRLTALGVIVLPGVNDPDTPVHDHAVTALTKHGIKSNDKGKDVAVKMHKASGMPVLRPHLF